MRLALFALALLASTASAAKPGYFRFPALHGDTLVFVAEGDLWRVSASGGIATRLTTHPSEELQPAISPDGRLVAFASRHEGPTEVFVMNLDGGEPRRLTFDGGPGARVQGWTPDGKLMYQTTLRSTLRDPRLYTIDVKTRASEPLPLADASEGCLLGRSLYFTRFLQLRDNIKGYRGGRAQKIWRFELDGAPQREARPFTRDVSGVSRNPMCWQERIYFLSDRDGVFNIWSMSTGGGDLRQHTKHQAHDVRTASLSDGRIAYQLGADLRILDVRSAQDRRIDITLQSDFEQRRSRFIDNPLGQLAGAEVAPDGFGAALVSRGQVYTATIDSNRVVGIATDSSIRARGVTFGSDAGQLLVVSDASGEYEIWAHRSDGSGAPSRLTSIGVKGSELTVSPDGRRVAFLGRDQRLRTLDLRTRDVAVVPQPEEDSEISEVAWSPDSRLVAFVAKPVGRFARIVLAQLDLGRFRTVTSDRFESRSPVFSRDGAFLYFISERQYKTVSAFTWAVSPVVGPYFDRRDRIYGLALQPGATWPYSLEPPEPPRVAASALLSKGDLLGALSDAELASRLFQVPVQAGSYRKLRTDGRRLYALAASETTENLWDVVSISLASTNGRSPALRNVLRGVLDYDLSRDRRRMMSRTSTDVHLFEAGDVMLPPEALRRFALDLRAWRLKVDPPLEWRQMFIDAWRNHRDHFWDPAMGGADWAKVRAQYEPLIERVTDRSEVNDIIAQMVSEARAMHSAVVAADVRRGYTRTTVGRLGADFVYRPGLGFEVERLLVGDPELLEERSPLARSEVNLQVGDIISAIEGARLSHAQALGEALINRDGLPTILGVKRLNGGAEEQIVVLPLSATADQELRYVAWGQERRDVVERSGGGQLGYIHLRGLFDADAGEFVRKFLPLVSREGLILDLRGNGGGDVSSWIIDRLASKVWHFFANGRSGSIRPSPSNSFRGHLVVLIDSDTYSDGERLAEGLRRLGLATLIGVRTAGAGLALYDVHHLRDGGRPRVSEWGYFAAVGQRGSWLVEGVGVEPDIVVDNLPHQTFRGRDEQLDAAINFLKQKVEMEPLWRPTIPAMPSRRIGHSTR